MKQYKQTVFNISFLALTLGLGSGIAQESKTYTETFKVEPDVVVELNTSHADIEFETWNKNEVVVEATIELEGATKEEAAAFFESGGVEILGNSTDIKIRTQADQKWAYRVEAPMVIDMDDIDFEIPEIPNLAPMIEEIMAQIPELVDMPPMPPIPDVDFDYQAYKKGGDKYMEKWQKEYEKKFEKEFDEKYEKELEAWSKEMEERAKRIESRMKKHEAERAEMREQMERQREEMSRQREEVREQAQVAREQARKQVTVAREKARKEAHKSRVFYMRGEGGDRNFSIKKTIKIKMPKNARIKMNVRHGEVKLADNVLNMQATLSYARLFATNIDGKDTSIEARYSPVTVKYWKGGSLQADFSEGVRLNEVGQLKLVATSSVVNIDRLLRQASINNQLGALQIGAVAEDFEDLQITVQNGEFSCGLPGGAYRIEVTNNRSKVTYPENINWGPASGGQTTVRSGYHGQKNSGRAIAINAAYSEVKLNQ